MSIIKIGLVTLYDYNYGSVLQYSNVDLPDDIKNRFKQSIYSAAAFNEQQDYEIFKLFKEFSKNNIDYMPLKGIILKRLYPNPEMRVMSDIDILIKIEQYDIISKIMELLGYSAIKENDHEIVWRKPSITIELHKRLIPSYNKDYYAYFGDGWRLAKSSSTDDNRYKMTPEDQLIYLFTHFSKHYRRSGIGIKHLIDIWVYKNENQNLNEIYLQNELTKLHLYEFYLNILKTIDVWFYDVPSIDITDFITTHIFDSGVYGTHKNKILTSAIITSKTTGSASGVRRKRIFDSVFPPYHSMCNKYPILNKLPILLPMFWMVRIMQVVIFKRQNIKRQQVDINIMTDENIENHQKSLNCVGLDFHFKE